MNKGDAVRVRKSILHHASFFSETGIVIEIDRFRRFPVKVKWSSGEEYRYKQEDLETI